jgi:hypothetical protein
MGSRSVLQANVKGAVSPAGGTLKTAEEKEPALQAARRS